MRLAHLARLMSLALSPPPPSVAKLLSGALPQSALLRRPRYRAAGKSTAQNMHLGPDFVHLTYGDQGEGVILAVQKEVEAQIAFVRDQVATLQRQEITLLTSLARLGS